MQSITEKPGSKLLPQSIHDQIQSEGQYLMRKITFNYMQYILAIVMLGLTTIPVFAASNNAFSNSNRYGKVTPTDVYSILTNYENLFMRYVDNHNKNLASKIKAVEFRAASGKTPENAFVKLNQLSDSVDKLIRKENLSAMPRVRKEKATAIPAEVYTQTGNILDALAKLMVKLEPESNWGDYYAINTFKKGKKPSDVYALADLSIRRLNIILRWGGCFS